MDHPITSFRLQGSKYYQVHSFFTAVHMILSSCFPPNQCFTEYLDIFLLLGFCLRRTLSHLKRRVSRAAIPSTISLLVVTPSPNRPGSHKPFISRAAIGFSACGPEREKIIKDRRNTFPELAEVEQKKGYPKPGNCAEVETLYHLDEFVQAVRQGTEGCEHVVAVTVAVDLMSGKPKSQL